MILQEMLELIHLLQVVLVVILLLLHLLAEVVVVVTKIMVVQVVLAEVVVNQMVQDGQEHLVKDTLVVQVQKVPTVEAVAEELALLVEILMVVLVLQLQ
jgi:hypothetical protein